MGSCPDSNIDLQIIIISKAQKGMSELLQQACAEA